MKIYPILLALFFTFPALAEAAAEIETAYGGEKSVVVDGEDVFVRDPILRAGERGGYAAAAPIEGEERTLADRYCRSIGYQKQVESSFRNGYVFHGRGGVTYNYARIDENGRVRAIEKNRAEEALVLLSVRCTKDADKEAKEPVVKTPMEVLRGR